MANKIQIKKFLEKKQSEVLSKLKEESEQKQEAARKNFFDAYMDKFTDIKNKVSEQHDQYEKLISSLKKMGIAAGLRNYNDAGYELKSAIDKLSLNKLSNYYIEVIEATKIKQSYEKKIEETKREYDNLIALCQANTAKDGITILENLGFDTSEIEVKQESTALITNIDAKKLFIN